MSDWPIEYQEQTVDHPILGKLDEAERVMRESVATDPRDVGGLKADLLHDIIKAKRRANTVPLGRPPR